MTNLRDVPLHLLDSNPWQSRRTLDKESVAKLVSSIRAIGLIHPITVRPAGSRFQIACGHLRATAAKKLGMKKIPVIVRELDDKAMRIYNIAENLSSSNLPDRDQEDAVFGLWEEFYSKLPVDRRHSHTGRWTGVVQMAADLGLAHNTIGQILAAHAARSGSAADIDISTRDMVTIGSVKQVDEQAAKELAKARAAGIIDSLELREVASMVRDAPDAGSRADVIDRVLESANDAKALKDFAIEDADELKTKFVKGPEQRAVERAVGVYKKVKTAFVSSDVKRLSSGASQRILHISQEMIEHLQQFQEETRP